jgi:hypothetical protein
VSLCVIDLGNVGSNGWRRRSNGDNVGTGPSRDGNGKGNSDDGAIIVLQSLLPVWLAQGQHNFIPNMNPNHYDMKHHFIIKSQYPLPQNSQAKLSNHPPKKRSAKALPRLLPKL